MASFTLYEGEMLAHLRSLEDDSVDALIADPPYSSGGFTRGDRNQTTHEKYAGDQCVERPSFSGDNRDGRSWCYWMALWLSECHRIVRPGGHALMFCDWRMLPLATDAFQSGGFVWRGLVAWDKGRGARAPHTGYFRHQCEYIVWGSAEHLDSAKHGGPFDGCIRETVKQSDKHHQTGKPTKLLESLIKIVPEGGTVLDPFMGSGTTGVACGRHNRNFIGIELSREYYRIAQKRVRESFAEYVGDPTQMELPLFNGD